MIDYKIFLEIKYLHQSQGLKRTQIAEKLNLDERTVAKWLQESQFRQRKATQRSSKLDPFKDDIVRMLETHPYSAVQIWQRIADDGFNGGYTIVKDYVRKVRPKRTSRRWWDAFAAPCPPSLRAAADRMHGSSLLIALTSQFGCVIQSLFVQFPRLLPRTGKGLKGFIFGRYFYFLLSLSSKDDAII